MTNITQMMKQAQLLQEKMTQMQDQLNQTEMTGSSGGGMVTLTINGKHDLKSLAIDPGLLNPSEGEILADLIIAAYNDANRKISELMASEMKKTTGGLKFPPGIKLPS